MSYSKKVTKQFRDAEQKDIEIILSQKDVNLHQLELCLWINENLTTQFLSEHAEVREHLTTLFEDINTYFVQKRLAENEHLQAVLDVQKLFSQSGEKIKKQPGDEVFRIFTTPESQIKAYEEAKSLQNILANYYSQTAELSDIGKDADLCYTGFSNDNRWNGRLNLLLDEVGKYVAQPEIEALAEAKIGAIFAYATFDSPNTHFTYHSEAGIRTFEQRMIDTVSKNPNSIQAKFYVAHSDNVLMQWRHNCGRDGAKMKYTETMQQLVDKLIDKNPKMALVCLDKVKTYCAAEYLANIYEKSGQEAVLLMLSAKIQSDMKENNGLNFKNKALAHYWGSVTNNDDLQKTAKTPIANEVSLDATTLGLLRRDKPLVEELKKTKISKMTINTQLLQNEADLKMLEDVIAAQPALSEIKLVGEGTLNAQVLLKATELKKLDIGPTTINEPEKLIGALQHLETIVSETRYGAKNKTDMTALYEALMEKRPAKLNKINLPFKKKEEDDLMEKFPDLLINYREYNNSPLQSRNAAIIKAIESKKIEDVKRVIRSEGLIEYLQLIDKKNRPSFKELNEVVEGWPSGSCFDAMRSTYGNRYFEMLAQVADLCGLKELQIEAKVLSAANDKKLPEYLETLSPKERPHFSDFLKQTVSAESNERLLDKIRKAYPKNQHEAVLMKVLALTSATDKDLEVLGAEQDFQQVAKRYAAQKKQAENAAATRAAFEKWKEEHRGA